MGLRVKVRPRRLRDEAQSSDYSSRQSPTTRQRLLLNVCTGSEDVLVQVAAALAAELGLEVYGGDINTAYLNAWLGIRQYLRSIDRYSCKINGHEYGVLKALYGLRQPGGEWNSELNQ